MLIDVAAQDLSPYQLPTKNGTPLKRRSPRLTAENLQATLRLPPCGNALVYEVTLLAALH